jgi:hypothetical protein
VLSIGCCVHRKQDMLDILKEYGKTLINPKEVARVFGET